jgi:hemoglobin-like flavoprotein
MHFSSTFSQPPEIPLAVLIEHYQPYEFPLCPVINSETQDLVRSSWSKIVKTEYDCADTQSGKISGHAFFYNHFFSQLFKRLNDFSRIFPDIRSRADIFSKVMAFCISIRVEEIDLVRCKLDHLGKMHKSIIHHPYLFGIYASNIHSTLRFCLGEHATQDVMSAWLHLLAFILRGMLPAYFENLPFAGHYNGAVNAVSAINEKAHEEVRYSDEMKSLKSKMRGNDHTEPASRGENSKIAVSTRDRETEVSTPVSALNPPFLAVQEGSSTGKPPLNRGSVSAVGGRKRDAEQSLSDSPTMPGRVSQGVASPQALMGRLGSDVGDA